MGGNEFVVVGAGPAGAAFAYYASSKGYRVRVYDIHRPGHKPCGWAVPVQVSQYIRIPGEYILTEIRGFRVYLDDKLVKQDEGRTWGYIVDKPRFLNYLVESADFYREPVKLARTSLKPLNPQEFPKETTIIAVGSIGLDKAKTDFINAVQQLIRINDPVETDVIEIWFDSNLVGYYWVFPRSEHEIDIGVGGYGSFNEFIEKLTRFKKKRFTSWRDLSGMRGARINIGGVNKELFLRKEYPVIGEAAGFVYPITGEGIRPSIASAYALFNSIEHGGDPEAVIANIIAWITRQKRLLDRIRRASPGTRASVIEALPVEFFTSIGLGELTIKSLAKLAINMPYSVARLLRSILG